MFKESTTLKTNEILARYLKKVVIIDDDPDIILMIQHFLEDQELLFEDFAALDAESGLQLIRKEFPDLVILDIGLPDMSGLEVLKNIRSLKENLGMRVLILSRNNDIEIVKEAIGNGVDDYIVKPFNGDVLLNRIEKYFEFI